MAKVGYARVSTTDQNLDLQMSKLRGCDKVFSEKVSGADGDRPKLKECLEYVREGDKLVVSRLDRLARSTLHLCQILEMLNKKGVTFVVLDQHIDTGTSSGRLLFNMLAAIGQFEREIIKERQREGIRRAQDKGVQMGRSCTLTDDQRKELKKRREAGVMIRDLMKDYGLSKASIYRHLSQV